MIAFITLTRLNIRLFDRETQKNNSNSPWTCNNHTLLYLSKDEIAILVASLNLRNYLRDLPIAISSKIFKSIGRLWTTSTRVKMETSSESVFGKKIGKSGFENFFLEYGSHYFGWSMCDKIFNWLGLAVSEIWKTRKKRGVPLIGSSLLKSSTAKVMRAA